MPPGDRPRAVLRATPAFAGSCAGFVFGAVTADLVGKGPVTRAEQNTAWRRTRLVGPWALVTTLGDRPALAVMTGAAAVAALVRRRVWLAIASPLATVTVGSLARWGLSRAIGRERPPQAGWLVVVDGPSFPSRHATAATLGALALYRALPSSRFVAGLFAAAVAAVALSRVRLGVHWPTDVVAGIAFAIFVNSLVHSRVDAAISSVVGRRRRQPERAGAATTGRHP